MMPWWCHNNAMMKRWWLTDDVLMVPWRCPYDVLMRLWWYHDDAPIMHWWCTDDALFVHWLCTEYNMMHIGQFSNLHGRFYGGRINGDKTWQPTDDDDRLNIEQSASGRWTGSVLQFVLLTNATCIQGIFKRKNMKYKTQASNIHCYLCTNLTSFSSAPTPTPTMIATFITNIL